MQRKLALTTAVAALALAGPAMADRLNIYTWTAYIDPALIEKFEAETGISVTVDSYDSNEMLLARLQAGATGYDIAMPSQHYVEILIAEGLIQPVPVTELPNYANVREEWRNPAWDPEQAFSAPWHYGSASFAYRADLYSGPGESLAEFFNPAPELSGRLQVLAAPDEIINLASLYLGIPFCTENSDEARQILELLMEQKPHVLMYSSDAMNDRLARGEVIMAGHWNGYSFAGRTAGHPDITYAYPQEGVVGWFDSLVVPVGAQNVDNALAFMNFVMDPENIAINSNFLAYANAIEGSEAFFSDEVLNAPEANHPEGIPIEFGQACNATAQGLIDRVWTQLLQ